MSTQLTNTPVWGRLAAAIIIPSALLVLSGCGSTGSDIAGDVSTAVEQAAPEGGSGSSTSGGARTVTVERAIDADTIELAEPIMGRTDLRLVGVDAPESVGGEVDPLGKKASAFTKRRLEGERVEVLVAQDGVGPYDRLLANARHDGRIFSKSLLSAGYAQTLFIEPNLRFKAEFETIQSRAREQNRGIWGLPPSQQCKMSSRGNGVGGGC